MFEACLTSEQEALQLARQLLSKYFQQLASTDCTTQKKDKST